MQALLDQLAEADALVTPDSIAPADAAAIMIKRVYAHHQLVQHLAKQSPQCKVLAAIAASQVRSINQLSIAITGKTRPPPWDYFRRNWSASNYTTVDIPAMMLPAYKDRFIVIQNITATASSYTGLIEKLDDTYQSNRLLRTVLDAWKDRFDKSGLLVRPVTKILTHAKSKTVIGHASFGFRLSRDRVPAFLTMLFSDVWTVQYCSMVSFPPNTNMLASHWRNIIDTLTTTPDRSSMDFTEPV